MRADDEQFLPEHGKARSPMHLRFKLAAVGCAAALIAGAGVVLATPALATTDAPMCIQDTQGGVGTIVQETSTSVVMEYVGTNRADCDGTDFVRPSAGEGEISVSGTNSCITVEKDGNVFLKTCADLSAQEWIPSLVTTGVYEYYNFTYGPSTGQCLHASAGGGTKVDVYTTCNGDVNAQWFS
jgi:hypothetical protein